MTHFVRLPAERRPTLTYLVLVDPDLVADDIRLTITEADPAARVVVAHSAIEAAAALETVTCVNVAFIGLPPESPTAVTLAAAVRKRGGRLVFIGDEAEDLGSGPDWSVLERPFTTDCVLAALAGPRQTNPPVWCNEMGLSEKRPTLQSCEIYSLSEQGQPSALQPGQLSAPDMLRPVGLTPTKLLLWSRAKRSAEWLLHPHPPL